MYVCVCVCFPIKFVLIVRFFSNLLRRCFDVCRDVFRFMEWKEGFDSSNFFFVVGLIFFEL